jgi:hypothetical protein
LQSAEVATQIDRNSTFSESKDLLLVVNLTEKGYKALGQVKDKDLDVLMGKR